MVSLFKYESSLIESDYWSFKLPAENSAQLFAQKTILILDYWRIFCYLKALYRFLPF